jgi:hypothetical protein
MKQSIKYNNKSAAFSSSPSPSVTNTATTTTAATNNVKTNTTTVNTSNRSNKNPTIQVDSKKLPSQKPKPALNPVGFESGNIEYVRPKPDVRNLEGQPYWILSYITPTGTAARSKEVMVKCSGTAPTLEKAIERAKEIALQDTRLDVFYVDCGKFLPIPCPLNVLQQIETNYLSDQRLDKMMKAQMLEQKRDRIDMENRMKADKEKALKVLRDFKGKDYVPPDHSKHLEKQIANDNQLKDDMYTEENTKFGVEELLDSFEETMNVVKTKYAGNPGFITMYEEAQMELLEKMGKLKQQNVIKEKLEREKLNMEIKKNLEETKNPAVSDNVNPNEASDIFKKGGNDETI